MLRIIDRYLLKEVIHGWLAVTIVLFLILVSHRLVRYLADAAAGEIPSDVIFTLLGLKIASYLAEVMPFAIALGIVIGLGRLYRDNEMVVMNACGMGPWLIYKPLLGFSMVMAVLLGAMALHVSPRIAALGHQLQQEAERQAQVSVLGAGRFNELRDGKLTFYAERLSDDVQEMENLFIYVQGEEERGRLPQVVAARSAYRMRDEQTGDRYLVLVDGYRYEGKPGDARFRIMQFERYGVRIKLPDTGSLQEEQNASSTSQLLASQELDDIAELQWRLSLPLSVVTLVLLAVPLCRVSPRQGRYGRMVVAILVFVIFYNLLATAKVWVEQGVVPPFPGLWWVQLVPLSLTVLLLNGERLSCSLRRWT